MSEIAVTSLITGFFSILTAIITLFIKNFFEKKNVSFKKVENVCKDAIYGKWKGHILQTLNGNKEYFDVIMDLKVTNNGIITGSAKLPFKDEIAILELDGGFYSQRFIKINYENTNKAILQFGTFIFKISDSAKVLKGNFVGYGYISGDIIAGNVCFEKV